MNILSMIQHTILNVFTLVVISVLVARQFRLYNLKCI